MTDYVILSVCVASIVRIIMMNKLVHSQDFTWAMCQVFIWSCVEPFIGIVCACLPTYAPLVRHWYSSTSSQTRQTPKSASYYMSSGNSRHVKGVINRGPHAPPHSTLWCDDEVELTSNNGNSGNGYTYKVHTSGNSGIPDDGQNIHIKRHFAFSIIT